MSAMSTVEEEIQPTLYNPHPQFVAHLKKFLHVLKQGDRKDAGEENNVRRMKNYYLNNLVFPAMANLTFFFEAVSEYPELRDEFESQILDLLGVRRTNPKISRYGFVFETLVACMMFIQSKEGDFTVKFVHILERLISSKVQGLDILETLDASVRIIKEIDSPKAWTELLASRVKDIYDFDILMKGIPGRESDPEHPGGTMEERIWEFDQKAKRKSPIRTFDFSTPKLLKS